MNKMPAEAAQTPSDQGDLLIPSGSGESSQAKAKTHDANPSARPNLSLPLGSNPITNGEICNSEIPTSSDEANSVWGLDNGTEHFYRRQFDRMEASGASDTPRANISPHQSQNAFSNSEQISSSSTHVYRNETLENDLQTDGCIKVLPCSFTDWRQVNGGRNNHHRPGAGDDMENYFNANAHLLAYLEISDTPPERKSSDSESTPRQHNGEHVCSCQTCGHCDDGQGTHNALMNGDARPVCGNPSLNASHEEHGDFIETDIYPSAEVIDHGCDLPPNSSDEDLPKLSYFGHSNFTSQTTRGVKSRQDPSQGLGEDTTDFIPSSVNNTIEPSDSHICDYRTEDQDTARPNTLGVNSRLCTCSVVSYTRGRLNFANSQSGSSEVDEGVGGMTKASPIDPSPHESETKSHTQYGIAVTSDSSSYFSPEEVDFMDFDIEPSMTTPTDNLREFVLSGVTGKKTGNPLDLNCPSCSDNHCPIRSYSPHCDDCNRYNDEYRDSNISRPLHDFSNQHEHGQSRSNIDSYDFIEHERLEHSENRHEEAGPVGYFNNEIGGNDSGAGSQEHLDDFSSDEQGDEVDPQPPCPPRSCNCPASRYYMGFPVCDQHDLYCHNTNNLDVEVFGNGPSSDYEDELFNVSRQTSTSNFDQDENAFQDAVEDQTSNGFHSACSGSDLESEKNNHACKNHNTQNEHVEVAQEPSLPNGPPEIPLPIPSRGEESPRRRPPSIPPGLQALNEPTGSACMDCQNRGQRPSWSTQSSDDASPMGLINWSDYELPSDEPEYQRRSRTYPEAGHHGSERHGGLLFAGGSLDQDYLYSPTDNFDNRHFRFGVEYNPQDDRVTHHSGRRRDEFSQDGEVPHSDPIPDIFILNLLREKESRTQHSSTNSTSSSVEKVMIWSEYDAYVLQVKQIAASACGATAVINVLKALDIQIENAVVSREVHTNLRAHNAPLPEYLLSRSVAGCTAQHLIQGVEKVTEGRVVGRFFSFYPERDVNILHWLGEWMKKGAIPVLTLNLQKAAPQGWEIPDAWHHQMAYGVGPKGVYLTNPLEVVPESVIREQLTSDSELLVQRHDIITRWSADTDLSVLLQQRDPRWRHFNVLGQVVNILRESRRPRVMGFRPQLTNHIRIPAWYRSGVTLFVRRDTEVCQELFSAPDLPILADNSRRQNSKPAEQNNDITPAPKAVKKCSSTETQRSGFEEENRQTDGDISPQDNSSQIEDGASGGITQSAQSLCLNSTVQNSSLQNGAPSPSSPLNTFDNAHELQNILGLDRSQPQIENHSNISSSENVSEVRTPPESDNIGQNHIELPDQSLLHNNNEEIPLQIEQSSSHNANIHRSQSDLSNSSDTC